MTTSELEQPTSERQRALVRLKKRRDFHGHVIAYLIVNAALWGVWAATGAGYAWPAWVTGAGGRPPPERLGCLFSGAHHGGGRPARDRASASPALEGTRLGVILGKDA